MRAAVLHGAEDLRIQSVPDARPPRKGELRLRVTACGLCGTDLHEFLHAPVLTPLNNRHPASGHRGAVTIGHEFIGVVDSVGVGEQRFATGDRVAAGASMWCGSCAACREGRTNLCESYFTLGLQADGGMADYVTVPAAMCVRIPDGCADADAVLAQPLAIAMHAVRRSGVRAGDRVAVFGAGAVGSLVVAVLADGGHEVAVFDIDPSRLAGAAALGAHATHLLDRDPAQTGELLRSWREPFAVAFETAGVATGWDSALTVVRRGGRVVAVGLGDGKVQVDARAAVVREIDIVTSSAHVCAVDLPEAVDLLVRRPLADLLVDRVIPLDRIVSDGLDAMARGDVRGKVVVSLAD